jgi:tetratricopeptide (TPR) repeat protein
VAAAQQALKIESGNLKSHYVLAVALLRSGRSEDGAAEMERFRKLEADDRESKDPGGATGAFLKSSMTKLEKGRIDEALEEIRQNLRSDSDSTLFYLNLGIAQSRVGRHTDAINTFQTMMDRGLGDSFLVDFNLYREYEAVVISEEPTLPRKLPAARRFSERGKKPPSRAVDGCPLEWNARDVCDSTGRACSVFKHCRERRNPIQA